MKVEVIRHNDQYAHVFKDVRSVMVLGDTLVITVDDESQYEIPLNEIMTMMAEEIE